MRLVTVKVGDLKKELEKNREAHRDLFLKAQAGYREQVIAELDKMLEDAKAGHKIRRAINLPEPTEHTEDYDRALKMLEMSVDETMELTETEFAQYVMDDWGWKGAFTTTSANYVGDHGEYPQ